MRLQSIGGIALLALLFPSALFAVNQTYNEAAIEKLDGTIMVQHADGTKTALQTGSTVEKGDVLTVYDQSWVILKTHKGDRIGLQENTILTFDEYYIEGPDRQIRLLLQRGELLLKTNGCGSRQSFFEINTGGVVTSVNEVQAAIGYASADNHLRVQFLNGKLSVIDKDNEQKFKDEYMEHTWEDNKMAEAEAVPVDEMDKVNFDRFFAGDDLLEESGNNILLADWNADPRSFNQKINDRTFRADIAESIFGADEKTKNAKQLFKEGLREYNKSHFSNAKGLWESALGIKPNYFLAQRSLKRLSEDHPELKIDDSYFKFENQTPAKKKP